MHRAADESLALDTLKQDDGYRDGYDRRHQIAKRGLGVKHT